jgi:hypothetical protein
MNQSLQYKTKIDSTQPFHIYYDIEIINNDQKNGEPTPNLTYLEARNSPFINCPDNYFVSIIRFNMQTPSLPVFIPQVKLNQTDIDLTIYEIYFYNISTQQHMVKNIKYIPTNSITIPPRPPIQFQDLESEYYFVYTYQHWINMINMTLKEIAFVYSLDAPFLYFDTSSSLLKFYMPQSWVGNYKLYFNKQLQTLLDSFQFNYTQAPAITGFGIVYELIFNNNYGINVETVNNVSYNVMYQESTTIPLLNPIKSIVFTTGLFPIQASLTSPPKVFGADSALFNNGNNSNISPIITDFEVNVSDKNTYKQSIQYVPTGEYRLIDLYGQSPVSTLQLTIYWKDHFGNLHPFKLNSGCGCDIKIMFRRKDYNAVFLDL